MRLTEAQLKKAINNSVARILREFDQERFNNDVQKAEENDKIAKKFIEFIEKHNGGVLLQLIVDYESGNEFGEPVSPLPTLIGEFEDAFYNGHKLDADVKKAIRSAYNQWWYYAQDQLMPEDDDSMMENIKRVVKQTINEMGGGVHPNRQMDLFMDQDEVEQYHEDSDNAMFDAFYKALSDCKWSISGEKTVNGGMRYNCYSDGYGSASMKDVIEHIKETSPRPQNLKFVGLRKQYAPEQTFLGVVIYTVEE